MEKLSELLLVEDNLTVQRTYEIIHENFNLDFTLKYVRTILNQISYRITKK